MQYTHLATITTKPGQMRDCLRILETELLPVRVRARPSPSCAGPAMRHAAMTAFVPFSSPAAAKTCKAAATSSTLASPAAEHHRHGWRCSRTVVPSAGGTRRLGHSAAPCSKTALNFDKYCTDFIEYLLRAARILDIYWNKC